MGVKLEFLLEDLSKLPPSKGGNLFRKSECYAVFNIGSLHISIAVQMYFIFNYLKNLFACFFRKNQRGKEGDLGATCRVCGFVCP